MYLSDPTRRGHALIDRVLYLQKPWAEDAERRAGARIPQEVKFATKPVLAREMIVRALDGGAARAVAGRRADAVAASLPKHVWQRVSAGPSSKEPRFYDWAWIIVDTDADRTGQRWLLRRNNSTGERYRCYALGSVPLRELVRVAGLAGLDQHQIRRWVA